MVFILEALRTLTLPLLQIACSLFHR